MPAPESEMTLDQMEQHLQRWDKWRAYIAKGGKASWPRDEFEMVLESVHAAAHAQGKAEGLEEAADIIEAYFEDSTVGDLIRARIKQGELR